MGKRGVVAGSEVRFSPRRRQFDMIVRTICVRITAEEKIAVDAAMAAGGFGSLRAWIVAAAASERAGAGPPLREISRLSSSLSEVAGAFYDVRAELEELVDELRRRPQAEDAAARASAVMGRVESAISNHELELGDARRRLGRVAVELSERR